MRFEGNLIFSLETQFFPHETQFFGHFAQILHFLMDFREKFEWGDPSYAIFIDKSFGKKAKSTVFKSINRGHPSKNEEICSQE